MARRYTVQPEDFYDLLQEARIAEWRGRSITGAMRRYRRDYGRLIRVPAYLQATGLAEFAEHAQECDVAGNQDVEAEVLDKIRVTQLTKRLNPKQKRVAALVLGGETISGACQAVYGMTGITLVKSIRDRISMQLSGHP